jgi:hypothetical protein
MTVSCGVTRVARCEGCGALWLDAITCSTLDRFGLDDAARSLATAPVAPRRAVHSPFREPCERGASVRACPVCLRELRSLFMHDANVTIRVCEHGALIDRDDVVPFLLASDIRRTLAEMSPPLREATPHRKLALRPTLPGGLLLRLGAVALALSLAVPAISVNVLWSRSEFHGFVGFVFGPLVALENPELAAPVVANFFAIALLFLSRRMRRRSTTLFSLVFGTGAFFAVRYGLEHGDEVLEGFWIWCIALALFALGAGMRAMCRATRRRATS